MAKIVPSKKIGVPVPTALPADAIALNVYYGSKGFTPKYDQAARVSQPLANVPHQAVGGVDHWVFDTSTLPALAEGDYDFSFTLSDDVGNEGDFSQVVSVPLDREPPVKLGAPITLS